jgi:hypothetical protein
MGSVVGCFDGFWCSPVRLLRERRLRLLLCVSRALCASSVLCLLFGLFR